MLTKKVPKKSFIFVIVEGSIITDKVYVGTGKLAQIHKC
jgi:hypothetical protein